MEILNQQLEGPIQGRDKWIFFSQWIRNSIKFCVKGYQKN